MGRFTPSRIPQDSVAFTQIIEQRRQRRELAPDAGISQLAGFEVLAPCDHMRPRDPETAAHLAIAVKKHPRARAFLAEVQAQLAASEEGNNRPDPNGQVSMVTTHLR
jgi:hypothetical protein